MGIQNFKLKTLLFVDDYIIPWLPLSERTKNKFEHILKKEMARVIVEQDWTIAEQDRIIAELERIIAEQDRANAELNRRIAEMVRDRGLNPLDPFGQFLANCEIFKSFVKFI